MIARIRSCFLQCLCLSVIFVVYGFITHYGTKTSVKWLLKDMEKKKKVVFQALLQFHDELFSSVGWCWVVAMVGALYETRSIRNITFIYWSSRTVILGSIVGTLFLNPILNVIDGKSYGQIMRKTIEEEAMDKEIIYLPLQVVVSMAVITFLAGVGGVYLHDLMDERKSPNAAPEEGVGYLFHWVRSVLCAITLLILKGATAGVHATLPSKPLVLNTEKNHSMDSYLVYDIVGGFVAELIATLVPNRFELKSRLTFILALGFTVSSGAWGYICHQKLDPTNTSLIGLTFVCGVLSNASITLLRDAGAIHPGTRRIVGSSFVLLDVAGSIGAALGATYAAHIYKNADADHYDKQTDENWGDVQVFVMIMLVAAIFLIYFTKKQFGL